MWLRTKVRASAPRGSENGNSPPSAQKQASLGQRSWATHWSAGDLMSPKKNSLFFSVPGGVDGRTDHRTNGSLFKLPSAFSKTS